MNAGTKNPYYCEDCQGYTVTVHVDAGTAPMFILCRARNGGIGCTGLAQSMGYPDEPWPQLDHQGAPIPTEPGWEWYRPVGDELSGLDEDLRADVAGGSLLIRPAEAMVT